MNDRYLFKAKTACIVGESVFPKKEGEWVKGYLRCDCGKWLIYQFEYDYADQIPYEVDPSTICQCTGLKDKSGTLIWENDIIEKEFYTDYDACVNYEKYVGNIIYELGAWSIVATRREITNIHIPLAQELEFTDFENHCSVIGNIFDNPELLEENL